MTKYKNPQEWLNSKYPKENRKDTKNLDISNKNLKGSLKLEGFDNLERLDCSENLLTNLDLSDCSSLKHLDCSDNHLANLNILNVLNKKKLLHLDMSNNKIFNNLTLLNGFTSLRELWLDNNYLYGSLKPLWGSIKLKSLSIADTDVNSGLEYLPESVENFSCSAGKRPSAKTKNIYSLFANNEQKTYEDTKSFFQNFLHDYKNWRKLNFTETEIQRWIEVGLKINEPEFANHLKQESYQWTTPNIQETIKKETWRDISYDFNYSLRKEWEQRNLNHDRTKEWVSMGTKPNDAKFVSWLKNVKGYKPEWVADYKEDYELLSERFKKYGVCSECNQPNTGEQWCKDCNLKHLKEEVSDLTISNPQVNEFIQKYQLEATDKDKFIEWIPYEQFINVEYLAKGGFGEVYKAKWNEGSISHWDTKKKQWQREKDAEKGYREVVLKSLNNSSENIDFLSETAKHKDIDDWFQNIVPCYGLSQDPKTGNYLMVMQYLPEGNLRHYLSKNNQELTLQDKLGQLAKIAQGLKDIHQKNLMHCDFHSGNILKGIEKTSCLITDLGLCKPVDELSKEDKVFGVMPYVAPEVLRSQSYTQAADIYSFGIIAWEVLSEVPPYYDREHDTNLGIAICHGLRPQFQIKIPVLLEKLIRKCWDAGPNKRPTANELERTLRKWQEEVNNYRETKFVQQLQEIEELNKKIEEERICQLLSELYHQYKKEVKEVKPEEIGEIKEELFDFFLKRSEPQELVESDYEYEKRKKREWKRFESLFLKTSKPVYEIHYGTSYHSKLLPTKEISKLLTEQFSQSLQINFEGENQITEQNQQTDEQVAWIVQTEPFGIPSSSKPK